VSAQSLARQTHPYVAVDVAVFTIDQGVLKAVLVRVSQGPMAGRWAFPGGFLGLDESPDAAAGRELRENAGIEGAYLEQLYTFGGPDRDPASRVVSIAYLALLPRGSGPGPVSGKYAAIGMFPVRRLPLLAYDHARIGRMALARLRAKLEYTNIVFSLLPRGFTLGELQDIYEAILGRRLDRRNFRRKLFTLGLLTRLPGTRRGQHRPASLYAFRQRRPMVVRML
jgi:8-oxo-dGTP diphosphatase